MPNLYSINLHSLLPKKLLADEIKSVVYHDCFDCPLSFSEIIKWRSTNSVDIKINNRGVGIRNGYYFLEGREGLIYKKSFRQRISAKKMEIAKKAAKTLSRVPGIRVVAVTGSLAMENSDDISDIDLMIVTKAGNLWTTRLFVYLTLFATRYKLRKPNDNNQRDALCLNMWLDESDLVWKERNIYTAHEIAQIVPLVNKQKTYEKFLYKNKWILKYWPNSVDKKYMVYSKSYIGKNKNQYTIYNILFTWFEKISFQLQYNHMRSKITCEVITATRALFHPQDWSKVVMSRLRSGLHEASI